MINWKHCYSFFLLGLTSIQINATNMLKAVVKTKDMIITSSADATRAGEAILRAGGTAVDAMIAAQAVLGLVRPQDSGIGGGAFAVYYDAMTGKITTFDGRETAPAAATEDRFAGMDWLNAWQSGLSVGVPGIPRLMEVMHHKFGKMEWSDLFQDAIDLAENGFKFHPSVAMYLGMVYGIFGFDCSGEGVLLFRDSKAKEYFVSEDCTAPPPDKTIYNPEYATTLRSIASDGADVFYNGKIAYDIVDAVVNDVNIPGDMTLEDLSSYEVVERPAVCAAYKNFEVCGMGPPSSGGIGVGQILGILDKLNQTDKGAGPLDSHNIHLFTQAMRLAFADRNQYVADSDFVEVPIEGMLDNEYLANRSSLITGADMGFALPGSPPGSSSVHSAFLTDNENGTAHISIIDRYGNALSMTTTIESVFGNSVMVNGFLLNNELTDFSFESFDASTNKTIANRVEPNKRPRSSMSPTIVLDQSGQVKIITGSSGGSKIIGDTAQTIMNMVDFAMDSQEAANVPHYQNRNEKTEIESPQSGLFGNDLIDYDSEEVVAELNMMGHDADIVSLWVSKLTSIQIVKSGLRNSTLYVGGVDPRSDGSIGGSNHSKKSIIVKLDVDTSKLDVESNASSVPKLRVHISALLLVLTWLGFT